MSFEFIRSLISLEIIAYKLVSTLILSIVSLKSELYRLSFEFIRSLFSLEIIVYKLVSTLILSIVSLKSEDVKLASVEINLDSVTSLEVVSSASKLYKLVSIDILSIVSL